MGITKKENKRKKQQHLRILNKHTVKHSVVQSKLTKKLPAWIFSKGCFFFPP